MNLEIEKIFISNFKCFSEITIPLHEGMNILVGNNEAGKSTVLQALLLGLTCSIDGRPLKYNLSQYLFNNECVDRYLTSISQGETPPLPSLVIEVYFKDECYPKYLGNWNSKHENACGITLKVEFDDEYNDAYAELLSTPDQIKSLPMEFYKITWKSFARESIVAQQQPLKVSFIDSAETKYQSGSDYYASQILKDELNEVENFQLTQAYRQARNAFRDIDAIKSINQRLQEKTKISSKDIKIDVDWDSATAWQHTLKTYLDNVPFSQIGKGEQCIVKTNLALGHKKAQEANIILIEEPENHLSHTKLNELINYIEQTNSGKQIVISTHSSFVCNKLGFNKLLFLNGDSILKFSELSEETFDFFKKLAGYDTLRMLLCRKAILVEGDSDELIFQKAYMKNHDGKLPIQDGIDVISVGLTHLRFLEIAKCIAQKVAVITDNDGNYQKNITDKYCAYNSDPNIRIFADPNDSLNTLEPQFANLYQDDIETLQNLLQISHKKDHADLSSIIEYMKNDKTGWALKIFESTSEILFPNYIVDAVRWCDE